MSDDHASSALAARPVRPLVDVGLRHVDKWGKVWFGLIFWGSVLGAVGREVWPDTPDPLLTLGGAVLGLTAGLAAHRRGYWL